MMARVDADRVLLAKAAKLSFDGVSFAAPPNEVEVRPAGWKQTANSYVPYALAASVLIAAGIAIPLVMKPTQKVEQSVAKVEPKLDGTGRGHLEGVGNTEQPKSLPKSNEWNAEATNKAFKLKVSGSTMLKPGVPNEYSILAFDKADAKAKIAFTLQLKDSKDALLFEKKFTNSNVVNLPVKPSTIEPLTIAITATDGKDGKLEWSTSLPIVK
jgi:hypothetical protein